MYGDYDDDEDEVNQLISNRSHMFSDQTPNAVHEMDALDDEQGEVDEGLRAFEVK
jgi:hypothetical protein